ncbi:MAG: Na+ dependent nucleoside transporter N-terminal domain-containing protein, partial [Bacteroidota bacterium]|nr:Na+ dependent nucleoside transporter N-terminal domain-containing protein [Bacteroidota bacterium]
MKKIIVYTSLFFLLFITSSYFIAKANDDNVAKDTIVVNSINGDTLEKGAGNGARLTEGETVVNTSLGEGLSLISVVRGLFGMFVLIGIAYLFSTNRSAISWKVVGIGLLIQILIAIGILQVPFIQSFFEIIGKLFVKVLDFTNEGTKFLFKSFVSGEIESSLLNFAVTILPTIIFFSALTSVLFYLGIIQKIVWGLAWVMTRVLKLSGAESLSVAGNIFLGQTESPLMIKEYIDKMNRSEILLVMSGGM